MAVPVLDFSIPIGGDSIDANTASVLDEKASRIRVYKETQFSLESEDGDLALNRTLRVFFLELIKQVVDTLAEVLLKSSDIPRITVPIPVVLAGGTVMPTGFLPLFDSVFRRVNWPFEISAIRLATDPLDAVARGALRYAQVNYAAAPDPVLV